MYVGGLASFGLTTSEGHSVQSSKLQHVLKFHDHYSMTEVHTTGMVSDRTDEDVRHRSCHFRETVSERTLPSVLDLPVAVPEAWQDLQAICVNRSTFDRSIDHRYGQAGISQA